jgi:hypothetical protein
MANTRSLPYGNKTRTPSVPRVVVRVLATFCVLTTLGALSGVARADRLCVLEAPPEPPARPAPVCTGDLDDDSRCHDPSPGHPLPVAALVLSGKTSLNVSPAPVLVPPAARLLAHRPAHSRAAHPGHSRRIDRPPKLPPF